MSAIFSVVLQVYMCEEKIFSQLSQFITFKQTKSIFSISMDTHSTSESVSTALDNLHQLRARILRMCRTISYCKYLAQMEVRLVIVYYTYINICILI